MIFEVTSAHIEALGDADLRSLIGSLTECELVKAGHPISAVTYGGHQNAKDGGIDIRVSLSNGNIDGFVPRLAAGFQAKAENFGSADIKKEMRPGGKLRESIRELGAMGGAYIIVSSKGSVSDTSLKNRKKAMLEAIWDEPTAGQLFVDFYDKQRIATWVNQHPSVVAWVREHIGQPISGWRPFQDWSSSPAAADAEYALDDGVRLICPDQNSDGLKTEEGVNRLRAVLASPPGVVRLVGLSGVGKTRLVQALFDKRVGASPLDKNLAVYTDISDAPNPVPAELLDRIQNAGQRIILIIDNCGTELHRKLAARLASNSKVSLVTIEYDIRDDEPENTSVFRLEPASKDIIEKIIKARYPQLTGPEIATIAEFSEGNFRIALALANTSVSGGSLANLRDTDLFDRLLHQKNSDDPALLRAAKACALVYSFDAEAEEGGDAELPLLATLAGQSVSEFHGHVAELKRRQLVQSRGKWRALLPHALAHRLAKLALEDLPPADVKRFVDAAPSRLIKSFSRRLGCLHDSARAQKIVSSWLDKGGLISDVGQLNEVGITLLQNVAPVHPELVLSAIEGAARAQPETFSNSTNADGLVRLLRSLAYDPPLFERATKLIVEFARVKPESNNMSDAVNVLKSLFHLHLSGTHASPKQRANFIRSWSTQMATEDDVLVIIAFDSMLECGHFSSSYGFEFGARRRDYGYRPATYGEQFSWYSEAFLLAYDLSLVPSLSCRVRSMIGAQFRFLAPRVGLDDLISLAEKLASDGGWPEGWAGVRGALREARKAKHRESIKKLTSLEGKLNPKSLDHRISSYVLPKQWSALDLAEIDFDDDKKYEKAVSQIQKHCEEIGYELSGNLEVLGIHLPKLMASDSERASIVARAIGRKSERPFDVWDLIERYVLQHAENGKIYNLPGGFLAGVAQRDRGCADILLDRALAKTEWHPFIAHMQLCVGLDERGSGRLLNAIPLASVPVWTLRNLAFGRSLDSLGSATLKALIAAVAAKVDGLDVAIELLYMRIYALRSDKKEVTDVEREVARAILPSVTFDKKNSREPHMLAEIAKICLATPQDDDLVRSLLRALQKAVGEYHVSPFDYNDLVSNLAGIFPRVVLEECVSPENADNGARRSIFSQFREHRPCPLRKIADDELLSWAHEDPAQRFVPLAGAIVGWRGPQIDKNAEPAQDEDAVSGLTWTSAALRLIREAPDPVPVLDEFAARFRPSGWSGSLANILGGRQSLLEELVKDEDPRISAWAQAAMPKLQEEIDYWRKWEAQHDRERDERFEY